MAAVVMTTLQSTDQPAQSLVDASIQYGNNGDVQGSPSYNISTAQGDQADGYRQWNTGGDGDSFDTDWVQVVLQAKIINGQAQVSLSVEESETGTISCETPATNFSDFEIISGVQNNAAMQVRGVSAVFEDSSGNELDSFLSTNGPSVDMTDSSDPVGEQAMEVSTSATNCTQLTIMEQIRMTAPDGTYPDVNDIFNEIYINV